MQKTETINVNQSELALAVKLQREIETLKAQNERMKKLSTRVGFFNQFFYKLKSYKKAGDAFNSINKEYHSLFGQHRFTDYESFKQTFVYNGN